MNPPSLQHRSTCWTRITSILRSCSDSGSAAEFAFPKASRPDVIRCNSTSFVISVDFSQAFVLGSPGSNGVSRSIFGQVVESETALPGSKPQPVYLFARFWSMCRIRRCSIKHPPVEGFLNDFYHQSDPARGSEWMTEMIFSEDTNTTDSHVSQ